MTTFYQCLNCFWEGTEPDERTHEERHPYGNTTASETIVDALKCPECGSERIDELDPDDLDDEDYEGDVDETL